MNNITFTRDNVPYTAAIVPELPALGDRYPDADGTPRTVLEVAPWPPTGQQADPAVYGFSPWRLHLEGRRYACVAIHEKSAEEI